jgi:hypothetical protein
MIADRETGHLNISDKAARRLRDEFNSDVLKTVDELCSLPQAQAGS